VLTVKDLHVVYGGVADGLRGVDLTVESGTAVAVLGSNGAGKTTLLRALSNALKVYRGAVTSGSIEWDGVDLLRTRPDKIVRMGIVQAPEGRGMFSSLTVAENLRIGAFVRPRSELSAQMEEVLGIFPDLKTRLGQHAGSLSGGQQQMLAIGRALMAKPKLLLLDEPSLGLAPKLVDDVAQAVVRINREGTTVILVEQNASMALEMTDSAMVLENGRTRMTGPSSELKHSEEVRKLYLGVESPEEIVAEAELASSAGQEGEEGAHGPT
jgi:branched-chain amino acid transport system ATP-binding protein